MEIILIAAMFIGYLWYQTYQQNKEKVSLIRELSIALKSQWIKEYLEAIPEPQEDKIELVEDELVEIWDIDPTVLLRSLK